MVDVLGQLGFTGMGASVLGWMQTGIFWVIISFAFTIGLLLFLVIRKHFRLKYIVYEIVPFGNGKVGINVTKAGIFKSKSALGGLWDYGSDFKFRLKDNRIILDATSRDMHDFQGKKGFLVTRKPDDTRILVPLTRFKILNNEVLSEIAPADFRDASVDIIKQANKETMGALERYLPYIMLGGIVIFFVISFMLASQIFNGAMDKALKAQTQSCSAIPVQSNAP